MKKKGFTLIELLAVIVILGIITVIAVPKVLDIINKSRESASNSSIKLVKDAIKTQIASSDLTGPVFTKETDGCYLFDFDDQESGNAKILEIKNKDRVSGSIKYCNNTFSDDTLEFNSGNGSNKKVICKRASALHTSNSVTYGNLGTSKTLSSGDAFDCDVDGDGVYDSETERFYYVSDYYDTDTKSFDSKTAVLIYYNYVSGGVQNKNDAYSYDSSGENFHGPRTAMQQLPTTKQWSNIKLKKSKRAILNQNGENATGGGTLPSEFSYEGYAARLLTTQEVNAGCNVTIGSFQNNELDSCNYLFENTDVKGGYWLETPTLSSNLAYEISGGSHRLAQDSVTYWGSAVRPVIEVSKKNIDY